MAIIDVGAEAINRAGQAPSPYTLLAVENPANLDGKITTVEVWCQASITNAKIGMFYNTTGNNYKCRSSLSVPSIAAGSKRTYACNLDVVAGDLIGIWYPNGNMERTDSGGQGYWYYNGDKATVGDEATYAMSAGRTMSLKGIGAEVAVGGGGGNTGVLVAQGQI